MYSNLYLGTIQYYGDLNDVKNNVDIRNYFQTKDPIFGLGLGTRVSRYIYSSVGVEMGSFRETKSTINTFATTSFFQANGRVEIDIAKITHPKIPTEKQRFINLIYLGLGFNNFRSIAYESDTNQQLRQAKAIRPTLSYGVVFRVKLSKLLEASVDFGHNKVYSDVFDATIGEDTQNIGFVKDRKLSDYKTALDLWAGMKIGIVYHFNENR